MGTPAPGTAELPILVSAGPTGRAAVMGKVALAFRWIPLVLFFGLSAFLASSKKLPPATAPGGSAPVTSAGATAPVGSSATAPIASSPAPVASPPVAPVTSVAVGAGPGGATKPRAVTPSSPLFLFGVAAFFGMLSLIYFFRWTVQSYVTRRIGRADFFHDRIVIYKHDRSVELPWKKIKSVVARSPHYVQLVRTGALWGSPEHGVPTQDRATQLAILDLWEQAKAGTLTAAATATGVTPVAPADSPAAVSPTTPVASVPTGPLLLGRGQHGALLLVASGTAGWKRAKYWLDLTAALVYSGAILTPTLVRRGVFPVGMLRLSSGRWELDFVIVFITYRLLRRWLLGFTNARVGRTEIFEDSIHFYRGDVATRMAWSEVGGFDDGSSDFVRVRRRIGAEPHALTIPTPDEATRTKVLELLVARGLPRLEPGAYPS